MRLRPWIFALAFLVISCGVRLAEAAPIPALDVPATANAADAIVVGRADNVQIQDDASGAAQIFFVNVDRVLKGAGRGAPRRIRVQLDLSGPEFGSVADRRYGIFFLKRAPDGRTYTAANPYYPMLAARPGPAATASVEPLASVAVELVAALGAAPAELTNGPQANYQSAYAGAAAALRSIPAGLTEQPLRALAQSDRMPGRLWAVECLLMTDSSPENDARKVSYIQSVKSLLMDPPAEMQFMAFRLASAMEGNVKSPAAVPTLAALLGSSNVDVRRSAASTLSGIDSRDIIRPLATVALHDDDFDVRYFAVNGLAAVTGHDVPTYAAFKSDQPGLMRSSLQWARAGSP